MAHTFATFMGGTKGRRWKVTDFLMRWAPSRRRRQDPQEQVELLQAFARRQRGNDR